MLIYVAVLNGLILMTNWINIRSIHTEINKMHVKLDQLLNDKK